MRAPRYFEKFKCVADRCTHSCCVGWEIDVDEQTLARYLTLPDAKGAWIKESVEWGEDGAHFRLCANERCPHLDERGLCRIIKTLGEGYLCDICREHPRFYNSVSGEWECGLGACCEEAARLLLAEEDYRTLVCVGEEKCAQNAGTCASFCAKTWRSALFDVLSDTSLPLEARCTRIAHTYGVPLQMGREECYALFASLEYLSEESRDLLLSTVSALFGGDKGGAMDADAPACERFLAYLIYRHASPAEDEVSFRRFVGFSLLVTRLFAALIGEKGLSPVRAAVLLSEELEYSEENTAAICLALAPDLEDKNFLV